MGAAPGGTAGEVAQAGHDKLAVEAWGGFVAEAEGWAAAGAPAAPGAEATRGPAGAAHNVLDPCCGSREVLELIADKWSVIVVYALAGRTLRYSELQRTVGGISQKMLTQTLRRMERDGLITRSVHPVVPPRVEYALSALGATLTEPLSALCRWAESHLGEVHRARARSRGEG